LSVAPKRFSQHLDLVAEHYQPLRLVELLARLRDGDPVDRCLALTFDDGYADNLLQAKPLLEERGVPATVFTATAHVRDQQPFWWDELEQLLLEPGRLPPVLLIPISGSELRFELGGDADYGRETAAVRQSWSILDARDPGPRQAVYRELAGRLKTLDSPERESALDAMRAVSSRDRSDSGSSARPLSGDELSKLAESDLIEIGAHTQSHPVLAKLAPADQAEEIAGSKAFLEKALARPIESFAYPYGSSGDFDESTVRAVAAAGFEHACTSLPGRLAPGTHPLRVPRIVVRNWTAEQLESVLAKVGV
jgi:peptidoglycan/xylan/chitin deacetylase (PgdA/CDA1 family)